MQEKLEVPRQLPRSNTLSIHQNPNLQSNIQSQQLITRNASLATHSTNESNRSHRGVPQASSETVEQPPISSSKKIFIAKFPTYFKETKGGFFAYIPEKSRRQLKRYLCDHKFLMENPSISIKVARNKQKQLGFFLCLTAIDPSKNTEAATVPCQKTAKRILTEIITTHTNLGKAIQSLDREKDDLTRLYERFVLQFESTEDLFAIWPYTNTEFEAKTFAHIMNKEPIIQTMSKEGIQLTAAELYGKNGVTFTAPSCPPRKILARFIELINEKHQTENTILIAETSPDLSTSTSSESNSIPETSRIKKRKTTEPDSEEGSAKKQKTNDNSQSNSNSNHQSPEANKARKRKTTEPDSEESAAKRQKTNDNSQSNSTSNHQIFAPPALKHRQDLLRSRSSASLFKVYKAVTNTNKLTNSEPNNRNNSNLGPK